MAKRMKPGDYIQKILLHEQSLKIPGLGEFTKTLSPAEIHPVKHSFKPPSAVLSFTADKNIVSTRLRDEIQKSENISAEEAETVIKEFVDDTNKRLQDGNKVNIPPLGTLKIDLNGNISTELNPEINLNPNSFGLPEFVSPAIQRRQTAAPTLPPQKKSKLLMKILIPAASVIFIAGLALSAYKMDYLNFIFPQEKLVVNQAQNENTEGIIVQSYEYHPAAETTENVIAEESEIAESPVEPPAESIAQQTVNSSGPWFILAACFGSKNNADRYLEKLISEGYPASIEGQTRSGLYRVCYNSFSTEEDAKNALKEIHQINANAYIVKLNQ